MYLNGPRWSIIQDYCFDIFKRELLICDVTQGLIRIPLFCEMGIPLSRGVIVHKMLYSVYSLQRHL